MGTHPHMEGLVKCGVCHVDLSHSWQLARFGCCSMGFCRDCLSNIGETCPGCRQTIPIRGKGKLWVQPPQKVPLRPFMSPSERWDSIVRDVYRDDVDYHNPICVINSKKCSVECSATGDLCRWHRARMATVMYDKCLCGPQVFSDGDGIGRSMFRQYYGDFPCISFTGMYCCASCNNADDYVARCGNMAVCSNCLHLHNPANLIATSWDEEHPD